MSRSPPRRRSTERYQLRRGTAPCVRVQGGGAQGRSGHLCGRGVDAGTTATCRSRRSGNSASVGVDRTVETKARRRHGGGIDRLAQPGALDRGVDDFGDAINRCRAPGVEGRGGVVFADQVEGVGDECAVAQPAVVILRKVRRGDEGAGGVLVAEDGGDAVRAELGSAVNLAVHRSPRAVTSYDEQSKSPILPCQGARRSRS